MNPHPMRPQIPMNMPQRQPMQQQPFYYDQYGRVIQQPMQQQPMQQPMMMQQPMYPSQQPMQQMYPNQQGMQQPIMQQPQVMVDQYGRVISMQMQPGMVNTNQQYIPNLPPQPNRFGDPSVTTRLTSSTVIQEDSGNRYQTPQPQPVENKQMITLPTQASDFTVKATRAPLSVLNDTVTVITTTESIRQEQLVILNLPVLAYSFSDAIENIIEHVYTDEDKSAIKAQTAIVCTNYYNCTVQETITEFFDMNIKSFYKDFKSAYAALKNKYDINLFNDIDKIITNRINDFLAINVNKELNIESFSTDFNELLKHLRNTTETVEDDLCNHMDSYLNLLNENNKQKIEGATPNCISIIQEHSLVYLDKLEVELGLTEVDGYTVKLSNSPVNNFIKSLADCAFNSFERNRFNVITIDRKVFEFISNIEGDIFVTRLVY